MKKKQKNPIIRDVINFFGSQVNLANALDVSQSAVSQWLNNQTKINADSAEDIELLTNGKFTKAMLRPRKQTKTPSDN
ncbi:helix-turn-helix domain-containing protein [Moraxella bovis]|uniref:transcriptional regulator n=1 Tax=Moraxella bovis TaxID=476 RepID=UPI002225C115|nr:helix-turn-helix domain-containing protein [Moraxella bovis]UYZ79861.1 helix-turn-helix domain-containing protein [Moraxella bovis]UYZ90749.1 helix-turn-helix domain-containing protein [Moraxella bovis]UYZ94481.1 helix-turn-helix domain-containing protein [Moraxella bovis]UZA58551.1 helix-turn-helix domain-containing protein [Moraxella bovis]